VAGGARLGTRARAHAPTEAARIPAARQVEFAGRAHRQADGRTDKQTDGRTGEGQTVSAKVHGPFGLFGGAAARALDWTRPDQTSADQRARPSRPARTKAATAPECRCVK